MTGAVLVATVTTALYYLGARAEITRWLWSRYPRGIAALMNCAACAGFWYGAGTALALHALRLDVLGVPSGTVYHYTACALVGLVWTPVLGFAHAYAYSQLSASDDVYDDTGPGAA